MGAILLFLAVIFSIAGWWLARQGLMAKPWLETGDVNLVTGKQAMPQPASKVGLGVFLAVVGALFTLFLSAYFIRMDLPDWRSLAMPRILWLNTGILLLSSVALHFAVLAARKGNIKALRQDLLAGAAAAVLFLIGQGLAWDQIAVLGYFATSNPASSFFYLITGVHAVHMIGGMIALGRTTRRAYRAEGTGRLAISTELCATYWHFMLVIWLVIMALLAGWLNEFADVCRQFLS